MYRKAALIIIIGLLFSCSKMSNISLQKDEIDCNGKKLTIAFVKHASLIMEYKNKIIYVDPVRMFSDYKDFPKADIILITHAHSDHLDSTLVKNLIGKNTVVIGNNVVKSSIKDSIVMENGDVLKEKEIEITAVPAYNTTEEKTIYHPKGKDNGYILNFNGKKVYIAGDTENTPEMMKLKDIFIAFLPMDQTYTMTVEQAADAAKTIQPQILYPYHYNKTNPEELVKLLENEKNIEVRIRDMQ